MVSYVYVCGGAGGRAGGRRGEKWGDTFSFSRILRVCVRSERWAQPRLFTRVCGYCLHLVLLLGAFRNFLEYFSWGDIYIMHFVLHNLYPLLPCLFWDDGCKDAWEQ